MSHNKIRLQNTIRPGPPLHGITNQRCCGRLRAGRVSFASERAATGVLRALGARGLLPELLQLVVSPVLQLLPLLLGLLLLRRLRRARRTRRAWTRLPRRPGAVGWDCWLRIPLSHSSPRALPSSEACQTSQPRAFALTHRFAPPAINTLMLPRCPSPTAPPPAPPLLRLRCGCAAAALRLPRQREGELKRVTRNMSTRQWVATIPNGSTHTQAVAAYRPSPSAAPQPAGHATVARVE